MDNKTPAALTPRKKGPVRFEAIIPLAIVIVLVTVYFKLFFDMHLRHGLEYAATKANGAEVNIGKLDTNVWNASVVIGDIAMTNPEMPSTNRVQIGAVTFRMLWDALLRGKVVINEALINNVQIDTPRKSPGRVLPVKLSEDSQSVGEKILDQMKQEFSGNVVGDLAAIAGGADPKAQLASIGADLKSSEQLDSMQQSLDEKNKQWQARIAVTPTTEDFSALRSRLAKVKLDNLQDVTQVQTSFNELESIRNDFDAKSKLVSETGTALTNETATFKASFSGLDKIVRDDVSSLQAKMHLPSLDTKTLSRALFGMDVLGKVQQVRGYMVQARSYMPVKSDKKAEIVLRVREQGHDYVFGTPNSYPRFWLRRALISSPSVAGASDVSGEILDVTTNPAMVGHPMIATLKGSFPQKGISGINASLVIDHTKSVASEHLLVDVQRYDVSGRSLVNSPSVELGFTKAEASLKFVADLNEDNVSVRMNNEFTHVAFETKAESAVVREMMAASVAGLDTVNLNARVSGTWSTLDMQLTTNLADSMAKGMRRYLQGKMEESRARIENLVNDKIKEQRAGLNVRQGEIESALKVEISERQAQVDKLRAELDSARNKLEARKNAFVDEQQQKLKQGTDKALDNLRKIF